MVRFLFVSLEKAWDLLEIGGYLLLHLGDTETIRIAEATNLFIEEYLSGSYWRGVIGVGGESGFRRPVWVWEKTSRLSEPLHSMQEYFPTLATAWEELD